MSGIQKWYIPTETMIEILENDGAEVSESTELVEVKLDYTGVTFYTTEKEEE